MSFTYDSTIDESEKSPKHLDGSSAPVAMEKFLPKAEVWNFEIDAQFYYDDAQ